LFTAPTDLTDEQWNVLEPLLPPEQTQSTGRAGRPWKPARDVLNGILWVMRTGAPWEDLPERYPPYQTCHRRFQQWGMDGTFERILRELARDLEERGGIDERLGDDGRRLRRYKRRWKVERLFAWLFNLRRVVMRYELHTFNFESFLRLACAIILLRRL
jgi:transposase